MTALVADRNTPFKGDHRQVSMKVAASTEIFKGAIVCASATGYLVPADDAAGLIVVGISEEHVDNSSGSDGDLSCVVQKGVAGLRGGTTPPVQADIGRAVFVEDDAGVETSAGSVNNIQAGILDSIVGSLFYVKLFDESLPVGTVIAASDEVIAGDDLGTPDLLDDDRFLLSVVMQATAYTLDETTLPAGNPPRNVIITHTTDTTTDTLGDAVVVGTDVDDGVISETLTVSADGVVTGAKAFKTITSVTTASWVQGGGVSDLIEVGFGNLLGLSATHAAAAEIFLAALAGVTRLPDAVAVDAADVESNTISLTGGTYDGTKTAKVLIKL